MPSCDRFYNELYNCLIHSSCVLVHEKSPQQCLDMIPDKMIKSESADHAIAPTECRTANRSWAECRLNLLSPKRRFRGSYGSDIPKDEDA